MREPAFLRKNKDKWLAYESALFAEGTQDVNPDQLADLYIQLTDDLGYARTFFPESQTVKYLNGLAARTHLLIYKNKKEKRSRLLSFWTEELPLIMRDVRKEMLFALAIFCVFFLIGYISTLKNSHYFEDFMGDYYTKVTTENIAKGDPTAIYKGSASFPMFIRIFFNNVRVSFSIFAMGIFFSVGTIFGVGVILRGLFSWMGIFGTFSSLAFAAGLFHTGIMLGTFLGNFVVNDVAYAIPIIWIHGALEISAIIIAGGAGLVLGNSVLFPETYTRKESIKQGAKKGVKIMAGLVPVFLVAAFLESYVTRYSDMPVFLNWLIVLLSFAFILWYFVLYPIRVYRRVTEQEEPLKLSDLMRAAA